MAVAPPSKAFARTTNSGGPPLFSMGAQASSLSSVEGTQSVSIRALDRRTGRLVREGGLIYRDTNQAAPNNTPIFVREVAVQGVPSLSNEIFDKMRELFCLHLDATQAKAAINEMPTEAEKIAINAERDMKIKEASALGSIREDLAVESNQCKGETQFALTKEDSKEERNNLQRRHEQHEEKLQIQRLILAQELELIDQITRAQSLCANASSTPQNHNLASGKTVKLSENDINAMAWTTYEQTGYLAKQAVLANVRDLCSQRLLELQSEQQQLIVQEERLNRENACLQTQNKQLINERLELVQAIRARENVNVINQTIIEAHILNFLLVTIRRNAILFKLEAHYKEAAALTQSIAKQKAQRESLILEIARLNAAYYGINEQKINVH